MQTTPNGTLLGLREDSKVWLLCLISTNPQLRVSYNGSTSVFQADDAGSIPAARSDRASVSSCYLRSCGRSQVVWRLLAREKLAGSIPAGRSVVLKTPVR